jgi:hypothetical protein
MKHRGPLKKPRALKLTREEHKTRDSGGDTMKDAAGTIR